MFTQADLDFLTSPSGEKLLAQLATENLSDANTLPLMARLRKIYPAQQAGAALTQARLRLKAAEKFGDAASRLFLTDDALQQASHPAVRTYRASQLCDAGHVFDICCGIGADSLAFSSAGCAVTGIDIDPVRIAIAQHNARALQLDNTHFVVADARTFRPDRESTCFYDPARRDKTGKRLFDVEQYIPPLSLIKTWQAGQIVVKLSPGVDLDQVDEYAGCIEFISVNGDLKEAVLWLGGEHPVTRKATLITGGIIQHRQASETVPSTPITPPQGWLVEPDPALIRAGLVQDIAADCNGTLLDDTIAYFTTETRPYSTWVRTWQIWDWMPFNLKNLRAYLRERHIGNITVKKRGSPITPETLTKQLKLKGDGSCVVVLTRHAGQPITIICADIA